MACSNLFCGLDPEFLAEVFNVDLETARRLQSENDNRNNIVRVEGGLHVLRPPRRGSEWEREGQSERSERERPGFQPWERERERYSHRGRRGGRCGGRGGRCDDLEEGYNELELEENGFEETLCTMRLRENIGDTSRADIYTPQAGRINTLNSHNLPILYWLQLSAEHGFLHNVSSLARSLRKKNLPGL